MSVALSVSPKLPAIMTIAPWTWQCDLPSFSEPAHLKHQRRWVRHQHQAWKKRNCRRVQGQEFRLEFHTLSWMLLLCRCTMWSRKRNMSLLLFAVLSCYDLPYTTKKCIQNNPPLTKKRLSNQIHRAFEKLGFPSSRWSWWSWRGL